MLEINDILTLVNEFFMDSDIFVVEVKISDKNNVEIYLDSDSAVTVDDCADLSRFITENIDREKIDYTLMISSAGVTAPFTVLRQYKKQIGKEIVVTQLDDKTVKGILKSVSNDGIILTKQTLSNVKKGMKPKVKAEEDILFNFNEIKKAKLFFDFK